MFGFKLAKHILIFASALFILLLVSSFTQACVRCIMRNPAIVLTFSPDGKLLASSKSPNPTIELWQVPKMKLVKQLQEGQKVVALAFSADGKILAAGGSDWVSLWKVSEGRRIGKFATKTNYFNWVRSLTFSPDGHLLAAGVKEGKVYLWQMPQGKLLAILSIEKPVRTVVSLVFSPDSKKLAMLLERWVQLWDVSAKKLLWEYEHNHGCLSIAFTKDGYRLVGAGDKLIVLSVNDGKEIAKIDQSPRYTPLGSVSNDGKFTAFYDDYHYTVKVVSVRTFKSVWQKSISGWKLKEWLHERAYAIEKRFGLPVMKLFPNPPNAFGFAFSPDSRFLALGFDNGQIKLWRIK